MGGHSPLPGGRGLPGREEAQGRRGWGRSLPFSPGAKSSPTRGLLPWSRGACLLARPARPRPYPSAPRPGRVRGSRSRSPAAGSCNPIRGRGGRGHGPRRRGPGRRLGFQREPLGTSVEKADAAASHGPGAPAARPPPACSCRLLPRSAAGGEGEAASGSQAPLDSGDTALASPEGRSPAPRRASLKDGCLPGPRSSHYWAEAQPWGLFLPRLIETLLSTAAGPLNDFLLQRLSGNGGDSLGCPEDHSFGQHSRGPIQAQGWTGGGQPDPSPPETQPPWEDTTSTNNFRQGDSPAILEGKMHTSEQEPMSWPPPHTSPLTGGFPISVRAPPLPVLQGGHLATIFHSSSVLTPTH